jgi:hypothetical protein
MPPRGAAVEKRCNLRAQAVGRVFPMSKAALNLAREPRLGRFTFSWRAAPVSAQSLHALDSQARFSAKPKNNTPQ